MTDNSKEMILKQLENGEITVEALVDSFIIATNRSAAVFHEINRLEKLVETMGRYLSTIKTMGDDAYRQTARVLSFAEYMVKIPDNHWLAILAYIMQHLRERNSGLFNLSSVRIDEIATVPNPVELDKEIIELIGRGGKEWPHR